MPDTGFPFAARHDAKILILGSMPGRKSLAANQYYAHPQNAFWPIMAALFNFNAELGYEMRLQHLLSNHVALWDVAHQCIRPGSMDHAIQTESVIANDFTGFFHTHTCIHAIFFNGRKAESLFDKLVRPELPDPCSHIDRQLLPSTSPAHAALTRAQKLVAWNIVKQTLESV